MVHTLTLFVAALVAVSVTAAPIYRRDDGDDGGLDFGALDFFGNSTDTGFSSSVTFGDPALQDAAAEAQKSAFAVAHTSAVAAESAAGINIPASIAAASSSAAAVAATATVNPLDPAPPQTFGLDPAGLGQLSGLRAKLQIDTAFNDIGQITQDNEDIEALESENEGDGF